MIFWSHISPARAPRSRFHRDSHSYVEAQHGTSHPRKRFEAVRCSGHFIPEGIDTSVSKKVSDGQVGEVLG